MLSCSLFSFSPNPLRPFTVQVLCALCYPKSMCAFCSALPPLLLSDLLLWFQPVVGPLGGASPSLGSHPRNLPLIHHVCFAFCLTSYFTHVTPLFVPWVCCGFLLISDRCSPISESPDPIHLLLNEPPILYDPLHVPYPGFLCRAQPSTFHQSMGVSYHVPPRYFAWALFLFSRPFLVLALAPATLLINYMCPGFHARTPFWTPSYPYLITSCPHIFGLV